MKDWQTTITGIAGLAFMAYKLYLTKTMDAQDMAMVALALGLIRARDTGE